METQMSTQPSVPKRILVGLDGSPGSARALQWAIEVAKYLKAEVVAVYVLELLSPTAVGYGLAPVELPDGWLDDLRRQFESQWSAPLKEAGIRYRTVFETGARGPAPTLIAVAGELQADLIVTGSRGLGGFGELLLGSVSHQLVQHAPVPVVVIPREHRKVTLTAATASAPATVAAP
jgi:nucleotide-binding universal stress UspA family protein